MLHAEALISAGPPHIIANGITRDGVFSDMNIKAIIFDYAGVIGADGYWLWLKRNIPNIEAERDFFHQISLDVDCCAMSKEEFVNRIAVKSGVPGEIVEKEILELLTVFPEVKTLLAELKPKFKIGLLSNFIFDWLDPVLRKNELYQFLDVPIISTEVRLRKPDPEIYKLALSRLGVEAHEAIFIDDRAANLLPANELGMKTLLCRNPRTLRADLMAVLAFQFEVAV